MGVLRCPNNQDDDQDSHKKWQRSSQIRKSSGSAAESRKGEAHLASQATGAQRAPVFRNGIGAHRIRLKSPFRCRGAKMLPDNHSKSRSRTVRTIFSGAVLNFLGPLFRAVRAVSSAKPPNVRCSFGGQMAEYRNPPIRIEHIAASTCGCGT